MDRIRLSHNPAALDLAHQRVAECLAYEGMMEIPEQFEVFSQHDHLRRSRLHPDLSWEDACPAYALALATHDAYGGRMSLSTDDELEAQWDELRGGSTMEWSVARLIVREAWRWLAQQEDLTPTVRH